MNKAFERVANAIERALAVAFVIAVCLNFINVIGRYGLGRTILWADEVQIYIMVWMAFLGAVVAAWRNMHLRMDILVRSLPSRIQAFVGVAELLTMAVLTCFVLVQSSIYVGRMIALAQRSDVGGIPMWIPHSAVALGFGLIAIITLWRVIQFARGRAAPVASEGLGERPRI